MSRPLAADSSSKKQKLKKPRPWNKTQTETRSSEFNLQSPESKLIYNDVSEFYTLE